MQPPYTGIYELLNSSQIRFLNDVNRFRSIFLHLKVRAIDRTLSIRMKHETANAWAIKLDLTMKMTFAINLFTTSTVCARLAVTQIGSELTRFGSH